MSGIQKNQDVFGIVYDEFYRGNTCAAAIVERDDGLIEPVPNTKQGSLLIPNYWDLSAIRCQPVIPLRLDRSVLSGFV